MKRLQLWLEQPLSFFSLFYVIPLFILSNLLYCKCACYIFQKICPVLYNNASSGTATTVEVKKIGVVGIIICANIEEFVFRLLPLVVVQYVFSKYLKERDGIIALLTCVISISIVFGYIHGNVLNVMLQGIAGIFFSLLYLKRGGYLNKDPFEGLCSSTAAHALFNIVVIYFISW